MARRLVAGFNVSSLNLPKGDSNLEAEDFDVLNGSVDPLFRQHGNGNIYHEARLVADRASIEIVNALGMEDFLEATPGFLSFLFSFQFKLALEDIPLARTASSFGSQYSRVEIWNSLLNANWLTELGLDSGILTFPQSLATSPETLSGQILARPEYGDETVAAKRGLPLLIIGSNVDIELGVDYFRSVTPATTLNVLLKRNDKALLERLTELHPDLQIRHVFRLSDLLTRRRELILGLIGRYERTTPIEQERLTPIMPLMIQSIYNALCLEDFVRDMDPPLIFGTLEKSPLGVAFSNIKRHPDTQLVSYQHGIMSSTSTMDYFHFDSFLVWDDAFRQLVLKDGYREPATVSISDRRPRITPRERPFRWISRHFVKPKAVFFEQPLQKSPYSLPEYRSMLSTLSTLATEYGFGIWIKPHPRTYGVAAYESATEGLPKIHRLDKQVRMEHLPDVYQFAIGMTSTALLDFMRSGKQAVSFDPKGWAAMTGLPTDLFSYVTTTKDQLKEKIRYLIRR